MPRPVGSQKELEIRRREAIALLKAGFGVNEAARRVGASSSSVSRWKAAYEAEGDRGLDSKPGHGSSPWLDDAQHKRLAAILEAGALAYGFPNELWTLKRVREVIEREFGIAYHIGHVWRILRRIGFTAQKPERRCRKRDEAAIERFRNEIWPEARKKGGVSVVRSSFWTNRPSACSPPCGVPGPVAVARRSCACPPVAERLR